MTHKTAESTYDDDLVAATDLMLRFVDPAQCDGNGRHWVDDALNDAWHDGLTIAEWVATAVTYIPAGFRRSAE